MGAILLKLLTAGWSGRMYWIPGLGLILLIMDIGNRVVVPALVGMLENIVDIQTGVEDMAVANFSTIDVIGLANALAPLEESLEMLAIYYSLLTAIVVFRWGKSFVPTVAN